MGLETLPLDNIDALIGEGLKIMVQPSGNDVPISAFNKCSENPRYSVTRPTFAGDYWKFNDLLQVEHKLLTA